MIYLIYPSVLSDLIYLSDTYDLDHDLSTYLFDLCDLGHDLSDLSDISDLDHDVSDLTDLSW